MLDLPEEVPTLLAGKVAVKYTASDLDAMRAVADAAKKRSLADFNKVFLTLLLSDIMPIFLKNIFSRLSESTVRSFKWTLSSRSTSTISVKGCLRRSSVGLLSRIHLYLYYECLT